MCPRFAVIGEGPLGILNDQDSLLATTAGCQWRSATGSPSNRPRLVHGPSKVREATSRLSRSLWDEASLSDPPRDEASFRGLTGSKEEFMGGSFVGRAALAAFSAAGCAFEGQGMARIGGPPATSESVIILPAGSGDASQSRRPRLPRRKASRMRDMLTWGPVKLHPTVFRHHGKP